MITYRPLGYTWHVKKAHFVLQSKGTMPSDTRCEGASSEHVGASDLRQGPLLAGQVAFWGERDAWSVSLYCR